MARQVPHFRLAGYFNTSGRLIGLLALPFSASAAPAIYTYTAMAWTLLIVWLCTSPRLDVPYRLLASLAIVATFHGNSVLGTAANTQWVTPIGVFALLFIRTSNSPTILVAESAFTFVAGLTGPYSIFLTPLYVFSAWQKRRSNLNDLRRAILLASIILLCALTQVVCIAANYNSAMMVSDQPRHFGSSEAAAWINSFFSIGLAPFAKSTFAGRGGAIFGAILFPFLLAAAIYIVSKMQRFRLQAIYCLFFSGMIIVSGTVKVALQDRYFYIPAVLAVWFVCCLLANIENARIRQAGLSLAVALMLIVIFMTGGNEHNKEDFRWEYFSSMTGNGTAVKIPIAPSGWIIDIPADKNH